MLSSQLAFVAHVSKSATPAAPRPGKQSRTYFEISPRTCDYVKLGEWPSTTCEASAGKCSTCLHLLRTLAWDWRTNEQEARLANTPNAARRPEKPVLDGAAGRRAPARAPDEQVQASASTC
jgi:hypothetical protein